MGQTPSIVAVQAQFDEKAPPVVCEPTEPVRFDGPHSRSIVPALFRATSVEVTNDPRIFLDNVIARRLGAFETVAVAAVLLAMVSCSTILGIQSADSWLQFAGLCLMCSVLVMNLTCLLVVTQQYYQVFRLMTSGPTGFEIAKHYYTNQNVLALRHVAANFFFASIPLFLFSIGIMAFDKLGEHRRTSTPLLVFFSVSAIFLFHVNRKHALIFSEKYAASKLHERPLRHTLGHSRREHA